MVSKLDIGQIRVDQLDASCLAWISKFAFVLEKESGKVIVLRDPHVLRRVVMEAKQTESSELKEIYANLKVALRSLINSPKFDTSLKSPNHLEQDSFLSQRNGL